MKIVYCAKFGQFKGSVGGMPLSDPFLPAFHNVFHRCCGKVTAGDGGHRSSSGLLH
jgi:hypothetical protein